MSEQEVVSEQELNSCPDCEEQVHHGEVNFIGDGVMLVEVACYDCGWQGTEEWVHDQTVV